MLPKEPDKRIHRIAVALGGNRKAPIRFGDFGKGFVHVLDEVSFFLLLQELDTITDFIDYLIKKEHLFNNSSIIGSGGEEDVLAAFLHKGRTFPEKTNLIVLEEGLWTNFSSKPEVTTGSAK